LPEDCWLYFQKSTKYGTSLFDCVKSALENPDIIVGLYAPDPLCYDTFSEIFWPIIENYHKVNIKSLKSNHDYGDLNEISEINAEYSDTIASIRIEVSRTIEGFLMGSKLNRHTRESIKDLMIEVLREFHGEFYGDYYELNDLSNDERDNLINCRLLYANADDKFLKSAGIYEDWPLNRGKLSIKSLLLFFSLLDLL
jgi:arginine kinase